MAVAVLATRNALAGYYSTAAGSYIGLASGDPGTSATPASEATGGSPAYARKATTFGAGGTSASVGSAVTLDSLAATYTYILVATALTGNVMTDKATISLSHAVGAGHRGRNADLHRYLTGTLIVCGVASARCEHARLKTATTKPGRLDKLSVGSTTAASKDMATRM